MSAKRKHTSLLLQVALLFAVGTLLVWLVSSRPLSSYSFALVMDQIRDRSTATAQDLEGYIEQFPAHDWLIRYWYEHYDELDIEYDANYDADAVTAQKCATLAARHPELQLEYATVADIEALPSQDQRLYAEVVYSWLITRIDQMKQAHGLAYLFAIVTEEPCDSAFVLFIAAGEGDVRGNERGQIYPFGKVLSTSEDQRNACQRAISSGETSMAPNSDGRFEDFFYPMASFDDHEVLLVLTHDVSSIYEVVDGFNLVQSILTIILLGVLAAVCLLMIQLRVLRPLGKVRQGIRLYKDTKDSQAALDVLSTVRSRNELGELSDDVASLAREMDAHVEHIERITSEREHIATELSLASRIQAAMLPSVFPAYPDRHDFEVYASMTPAKEVGGDFYDFFLVDDDHLFLAIADVSGKGVPAALFMMAAKISLTHHANLAKSPAQILTDINESICAHNPEDMFVTVWLGVLDLSTGVLTAANGGHDCPIVVGPDGSPQMLQGKRGVVVGCFDGMRYLDYQVRLSPGSKLFLYTDGLAEAMDTEGRQFGIDRILRVLDQQSDASVDETLEVMREAVHDFTDGASQSDDLTMLCLAYHGPDTQGTHRP